MKNPKITEDEKIFAALSYVFPFQPFIFVLSKLSGLYTDFFKKHLKNSIFLYSLLTFITLIVVLIKKIKIPETLQIFSNIILILLFIISVFVLCLIFVKALKIFKDN